MRFSLRDSISLSGGGHNEDRFGQYGAAAWVVDGATDLHDAPLLPGPSDSAWLAEALNLAFLRRATRPAESPETLLPSITAELRDAFDASALRPIAERWEQPSAAGIFARIVAGRLEALSLGDSTLLALSGEGAPLDLFRAADERTADEEARAAAREAAKADNAGRDGIKAIRAELMPLLRAGRARLNTPGGYGIFSIDAPPAERVRTASRAVAPGDLFLLATDGFLRLVDVYGAYSLAGFGAAVQAIGLARLGIELRGIEAEDAAGIRFPRAKMMDDSTAMVLEVVA